MTAADNPRLAHPNPLQNQFGLTVARSVRFQQFKLIHQALIGTGQIQHAVNFNHRRYGFMADLCTDIFADKLAKFFNFIFFQRKSGSHCVAAAFGNDAFFFGGNNQGAQIDTGNGARRTFNFIALNRHDESRQIVAFFQLSGHDTDNPLVPIVSGNKGYRILLRGSLQHFDGFFQDISFYFFTLGIEFVELVSQYRSLKIIFDAKQAVSQSRFADPAAGINARSEHKSQMECAGRLVNCGLVNQCPQADIAPLGHNFKPLADKGTVQPEQRHHVADGSQRHQIEPLD